MGDCRACRSFIFILPIRVRRYVKYECVDFDVFIYLFIGTLKALAGIT